MWSYPALDRTAAATVYVKHENVQPTGAFKVRGGVNLLANMEPTERERGVVGYSTGNHAQSLAYAAKLFGTRCTIVMPENPSPGKAQAVRNLGAELREFGANFDEAREHAETLTAERGMRLVSAANEPEIIAGVSTAYLEIVEQVPNLDVIVVPVGGGSGASAACMTVAAMAPDCQVIAVQSASSPAGHDSWHAGQCLRRPNHSAVDGLATGSGFELTQQIMREQLTDFVLVDDADISAAQWTMMRDAHTLAEGAGATALAAVLADPQRFAGRRVAAVCSGGNAAEHEIRACAAPRELVTTG